MRTRLPRTLLTLAAAAALLIGAEPAHALVLRSPADIPLVANVRLELGRGDGPGLGLLYVDGQLVRSSAVTSSVSATFTAVQLKPGRHSLRAVVRRRSGLSCSPTLTVNAWGRPGAPKLATPPHAGLYPKATTLPVILPAGANKMSVLVNGKVVWTRAARPPALLTVPLALPAGVDTVELRAENPLERASSNLTLTRATWPAPGHYSVTSPFGMRWGRMHKGIDIPGAYGCAVVAVAAGKVLWAEPLTSYGNLVMIDHGGGMTTYYAHLSAIGVKIGQQVKMGQRIGSMGSAGSTHLHFQLFTGADNANPDKFRRVNSGTPVDPYPYVMR